MNRESITSNKICSVGQCLAFLISISIDTVCILFYLYCTSFLKIVGMSIMSHLRKRKNTNINIVHIHLAYEELRDRFSNLSEILNLTWKDEDGSDLVTKIKTVFDNARTANKVGPT